MAHGEVNGEEREAPQSVEVEHAQSRVDHAPRLRRRNAPWTQRPRVTVMAAHAASAHACAPEHPEQLARLLSANLGLAKQSSRILSCVIRGFILHAHAQAHVSCAGISLVGQGAPGCSRPTQARMSGISKAHLRGGGGVRQESPSQVSQRASPNGGHRRDTCCALLRTQARGTVAGKAFLAPAHDCSAPRTVSAAQNRPPYVLRVRARASGGTS